MQPSTEAIRTAIAALTALLPAETSEPRRSRAVAYDRVLAYFHDHPRTNATEIRIALELTPSQVSHALRDLVAEGLVQRTGEPAPRVGRGPRAFYLQLTQRAKRRAS